MEVDTGAAVSLVSEATRKQFFSSAIHPTRLQLKTYTSEKIEVLGHLQVRVQYGDQVKLL